MPQQLFAKIKKSSKYFYQNKWVQEQPETYGGWPFPIEIEPDVADYVIRGGPGGQYRITDVSLFARVGDGFIKLT